MVGTEGYFLVADSVAVRYTALVVDWYSVTAVVVAVVEVNMALSVAGWVLVNQTVAVIQLLMMLMMDQRTCSSARDYHYDCSNYYCFYRYCFEGWTNCGVVVHVVLREHYHFVLEDVLHSEESIIRMLVLLCI